MRTAVLINAISTGCLYGISAFGFGLIQKVTGTLHIFHGAVFLVAGYGLFSLAVLLELPVTAAVPLALVVAILVGIASDLVLYRPLSGSAAASELAFVASLGAFVVTTSILVLFFGRQVNTISDSAEPAAPFAGVLVAPIQVLNSIAWLGVTLLGWIGLTFTSFGRLLRALQSNPELLRAFGFNVNTVRLAVFASGSALAGIAGLLAAADWGIEPYAGFDFLLYTIVAVSLTPAPSLIGPAFAGLGLGLLKEILSYRIGSGWTSAILFGVLLLWAVYRPGRLRWQPARRLPGF